MNEITTTRSEFAPPVLHTDAVLKAAVAAAVLAERERCAVICDEWASSQTEGGVASMCARDIRGLPDEPGCLHEAADVARAAISAIRRATR